MIPPASDVASRDSPREEIERKVAGVVSQALGVSEKEARGGAFVLSGTAAFSSFSLLELIVRLEETFQVSIPDDHLDRERFETVQSIADYVQRRLSETK